MTPLLAIRHAPTDAEGLCVGDDDVATRMPAPAAAAVVVAALEARGARPVRIWTSPLRRCADLAAAVAARVGAGVAVDVDVDDRLRELSFGRWQGRAWQEIMASEPEAWRRWTDGWQTEAPPGGERLGAFAARVAAWWAARGEPQGGAELLVAHAGVVRALRVIVGGETWAAALARAVPNLALEEIGAVRPRE